MKFGETLNQNLTSEWRNQYIAYERIKGNPTCSNTAINLLR